MGKNEISYVAIDRKYLRSKLGSRARLRLQGTTKKP